MNSSTPRNSNSMLKTILATLAIALGGSLLDALAEHAVSWILSQDWTAILNNLEQASNLLV